MDNGNKLSYESEFQVDLEDLFTIDFNKLKLVLKTTLMNQDAISNKIKELENKIKNQSPFCNTHSRLESNDSQENYQISKKNMSIVDIKKEDFSESKASPKFETDNFSKLEKVQEYQVNKFDIDIENQNQNKLPTINENNTEDKNNLNQINNENKEKEENENIKNNNQEDNKKDINENNINDNFTNTNSNQLTSSINQTPQQNYTPINLMKKNLSLTESRKNANLKKFGPYLINPYENNNDDKTQISNNQNKKILDLFSDVENLKSRMTIIEKKAKNKELSNNVTPKKIKNDDSAAEELMLLKLQIKDNAKKINELNKENSTLKNNLEEVNLKLKDFNIYNIVSNKNGDDVSFDAARALVMSLEQKVFKKTGLVDEKIRRIDDILIKVQTEVRNNKNVIDVYKLSFDDYKKTLKNVVDNSTKNTDDIKNLNENITDIQNQINKIIKSVAKKFENLKTENLKESEKNENNLKELSDKIKEINQKLNTMELRPKNKSDENKKNAGSGSFIRLREEMLSYINELQKTDKDLEKLLENSINKLEINKLKDNINNIENILSQKGNAKDIIDLKNRINDQNSATNKLRDNVDRLNEIAYKVRNDSNFLIKRIDTLSSGIVANRTSIENLLGKEQELMMEVSKYMDIISFNQFLESYQKDKKKSEQNITNLNKLISEILETLKSKCGSDDMKLFEDIINNKLKELENNSLKKFSDKIETNKNIKYLDTQIRHIIDIYIKKLDKADSWLIAKKPLGGYSCASCEAYLGDLHKKQEFLPWNRYPENNKNYKIGNGFSRMLKMINADNVYESDDDIRNSAKIENLNSNNRAQSRRLNKNLSMGNIRNNVNNNATASVENCCNLKNNILPSISGNKGEEINGILTVEKEDKDYFVDDDYKSNEDGPHVVKVYRKKLNPIDMNKKE